MDDLAVSRYLSETFADILVETADGNTFFFHDPNWKIPFVTIVTKDDYDNASNLDRPGVYRLNIGVGRETYARLFGAPPSRGSAGERDENAIDFTALDRLMPHPVYASMFWVCILNPGEATFATVVRPLLAEAHDLEVRRHAKRRPMTSSEE